MHIAGSALGDIRHVCAFFSTPDDEYQTMLPFMREGLAAGERVVNFMPEDRIDHEDRLRAGGIDVDKARGSHQLEVIKSEDAYLQRDGRFDGEAMLRLVPQLLSSGRDFGYAITRLIAHAEHMTKDPEDADAFMAYESRLNYIMPKHSDPIVCTYDLNKVGAGVVMDILRTHPMAVVGGLVQENPFFVPPDEFLRQADERKRQNRTRGKYEVRSGNRSRR
jgi:hypothetical protein